MIDYRITLAVIGSLLMITLVAVGGAIYRPEQAAALLTVAGGATGGIGGLLANVSGGSRHTQPPANIAVALSGEKEENA